MLYIDALVNSINKKINEINWKPDLIIASYHGIPKNISTKVILIIVIAIKRLDLFQKNLVRLKLKLHFNQDLVHKNGFNLILTKLRKLTQRGVKNVLTICPGFASDCRDFRGN